MTSFNLCVIGRTLHFHAKAYACAIGTSGIIPATDKREGDGATPAGSWPLRECWFRPDRLNLPQTGLPIREIHPDDGWCDDPTHPLYNQPFKINSAIAKNMKTYERLWREEGGYNLIIPLGYNDAPPIPGLGSAIFLHVAKPDYAGTEGCIALAEADLLEVLAGCDGDTVMMVG